MLENSAPGAIFSVPTGVPYQRFTIGDGFETDVRPSGRWRQLTNTVLKGILLIVVIVGVALGFLTRHTADPDALTNLTLDPTRFS